MEDDQKVCLELNCFGILKVFNWESEVCCPCP